MYAKKGISLDAHFKELSDDIFFMTYNPYFVDQNYKSKVDMKHEVALYKELEGVPLIFWN